MLITDQRQRWIWSDRDHCHTPRVELQILHQLEHLMLRVSVCTCMCTCMCVCVCVCVCVYFVHACLGELHIQHVIEETAALSPFSPFFSPSPSISSTTHSSAACKAALLHR